MDWRRGVFYFITLFCNFPLEGEHFIYFFATKSVSWRGEVFYFNFFKALTSEFLKFVHCIYTNNAQLTASWKHCKNNIVNLGWPGQPLYWWYMYMMNDLYNTYWPGPMINISSKPPVPCSGGLGPRWIFWVWMSEKIYHHSLCWLIQTNMLLLQLAALLASNFELIYMGKQTKCMMIWCWCIWRRMASITLLLSFDLCCVVSVCIHQFW